MKKFTFFTLAVVLLSVWTACSTDTNTKEVVINSAYQKDVGGINEAFLYADTVYLTEDLIVSSNKLVVPQGKTLNLEKFKTKIDIDNNSLLIVAGDIAFAEGKVITIAGGGKLIATDGFIQSEVGTSADGITPDPIDGKVRRVKVSSGNDASKIFDDPVEAGTTSDTTVAVYAGKGFEGRTLAGTDDYIIGNESFNAKTITLDTTGNLTVIGDLALNNTSSIAKGTLGVYGVLTQKDSTYALNGSAATINAIKADFTDTVEFGGDVNISGEGKFTGANFRKEANLGVSSFSGAASFSDKVTFRNDVKFSSGAIFYEDAEFYGDATFSNNATFAAGKTYTMQFPSKIILGSPGNGIIISEFAEFKSAGTVAISSSNGSLTIPANSSLIINSGKLAIMGQNALITIANGGTLEFANSAGSITVPGYNITSLSGGVLKAVGANITLNASGLTNTAVGTQGILEVESGDVDFELTGSNNTFTLNGTILDLSGQGSIKAGLGSTIVLTGGNQEINASASDAKSLVTTAGNFGGIYLDATVAVLGGNVYSGSLIAGSAAGSAGNGYIIASGGLGFVTAVETNGLGGGILGTSANFEDTISEAIGGTAFLSWGGISPDDVTGAKAALAAGTLSSLTAAGTIAVFHK